MSRAIFVPCAHGTEDLLAAELQAITGTPARSGRGGAWVQGTLETVMRLNLECRIGQRVLWPLVDGPYRDEHELYALARCVPWGDWITPAQTLRVDVSAQRSPLRSLNFAALRIKDAVCDALREVCGKRPSVDTRSPTLPLVLHLDPGHAWLSVDTSGQPLFKRGWRDEAQARRSGAAGVKGEAPLKETLAAAMLAAAGWQGRAEDGVLLDPCCGAGTIAIEAAQLACGIAPGLQRSFAFEGQLPFRALQARWQQLRQAAQARVHPPAVAVYAGDVSFRMTDFAARNARQAGVAHAIEFKTADALQRPPPAATGTIVMNPPYGERIAPKGRRTAPGETVPATAQNAPYAAPAVTGREGFEAGADASAFFAALAAHWKRHYAGWTAWCLSPEMKLPALMRLKESRRVPMYNGGIECRLFRFDLVAGSNRPARQA
ncbi:MAG: THUMP domain-containing protein [Burkholderiales bacterium]|nr:THUMP domain-containing protein [Burkholderiales bacterium]